MNPGEYEAMAVVEGTHWWFRGLRGALIGVLSRPGFELPPDMRVLDAGCGTGGNLQHLADTYPDAQLSGFDVSPLAIDVARTKVPRADLYLSDLRAPEVRGGPMDVIISCDVLAIPGLEASRSGLRALVRHLTPGGLFILNVPAYQWLLSNHDMACHQYERYAPRDMRRLYADLHLSLEFLTHRVAAPFPLVVLSRLPSILGRRVAAETARSQVSPPPRAVNVALDLTMRGENLLLRRGWRMPWGSSLLAVGRKPTHQVPA